MWGRERVRPTLGPRGVRVGRMFPAHKPEDDPEFMAQLKAVVDRKDDAEGLVAYLGIAMPWYDWKYALTMENISIRQAQCFSTILLAVGLWCGGLAISSVVDDDRFSAFVFGLFGSLLIFCNRMWAKDIRFRKQRVNMIVKLLKPPEVDEDETR